MSELPEHVRRNRESWDRDAENWAEAGRRNWARDEPGWGAWDIPERELRVLPDVAGKDVIELGCGTAYWSAWLARLGARPVGIDNSERQLETARALQREHGLEFPLLHGNAEDVPLPDGSFDLALSEYGASIWCDPQRWIPEAARLLRPGGHLIFLVNSVLAMLCFPDEGELTERLQRPLDRIRRMDWPGEGVEFHLPHGELIGLLRAAGFEIEALVEPTAPPAAEGSRHEQPAAWAKRWPPEELWVARKRA